MPRANRKPIPSTIPYPQAWPRGEAEGPVGAGPPAMLLYAIAMQKSVVQSRWDQPPPDRRALSEVPIPATLHCRLWLILPTFSAQLSSSRGLQARHDIASADWLEIVEDIRACSRYAWFSGTRPEKEAMHKALGGRLDQCEMVAIGLPPECGMPAACSR